MDVGVLAVRYAKALYSFAKDNGVDASLYNLCGGFVEIFTATPQLSKTLEDPLLPKAEKLSLLLTGLKLSESSAVKEVLERFFNLVLEHRRENYLAAIFRYYQKIYRKEHNIGVARITTAVELEAAMEERIISKASHMLRRRIELEKIVDPAIEGGFILDIDDYRLNASVAWQIHRIKKMLIDKNKRIV